MEKILLRQWAKHHNVDYKDAMTDFRLGKFQSAIRDEKGGIYVDIDQKNYTQEKLNKKRITLNKWAEYMGIAYITARNLFNSGDIQRAYREDDIIYVEIHESPQDSITSKFTRQQKKYIARTEFSIYMLLKDSPNYNMLDMRKKILDLITLSI